MRIVQGQWAWASPERNETAAVLGADSLWLAEHAPAGSVRLLGKKVVDGSCSAKREKTSYRIFVLFPGKTKRGQKSKGGPVAETNGCSKLDLGW